LCDRYSDRSDDDRFCDSGPDPDQFLHLATGITTLLFGAGLMRRTGVQSATA